MSSKLRPIDSSGALDCSDGRPTGSSLNSKLTSLLKEKLAGPVYFRVAYGDDGELVIEQVAFLRNEQVAELIGFDDRTIRGWAAAGKIPCFKPPGSSVNLFELNEILRWIQGSRAGQ